MIAFIRLQLWIALEWARARARTLLHGIAMWIRINPVLIKGLMCWTCSCGNHTGKPQALEVKLKPEAEVEAVQQGLVALCAVAVYDYGCISIASLLLPIPVTSCHRSDIVAYVWVPPPPHVQYSLRSSELLKWKRVRFMVSWLSSRSPVRPEAAEVTIGLVRIPHSLLRHQWSRQRK